MPESVSTVDAILDGLRDRAMIVLADRVVSLDDAVAAVHAAWLAAGRAAATPDPPREEWRVVDGDNVVCRLAGHRDFGTFRPWAEEQCRGLVERFPGESFRIERRVGDEEWEAWCPPDTPMGSCVPRCGDARCEVAAGRAAAHPDPPDEHPIERLREGSGYPPAASPDERLREAGERLANLIALLGGYDGPGYLAAPNQGERPDYYAAAKLFDRIMRDEKAGAAVVLAEWRSALAAADRASCEA